jgi:signal transduction histidine kinase
MPFRVFLLSLLLLLSGRGFAQISETDSLESLVKSIPSDTTKVWLLNQLVNALREKDNNKALAYAREAKELAEVLGYKNGISRALENLGWILYRKGDFSNSLAISTQALKISGEISNEAAMARCLNNIAAIHYEQKQFKEAIENFRKAYHIALKINDRLVMARSFNNIAYAFFNLNQLDSARAHVQHALMLSRTVNEPYQVAFAYRTLGDINLSKNNTSEAILDFNKCLDLSIEHSNTFLKASVLHRLAKTYAKLGKYEQAISYLTENVAIANQYGFKDELERAYKMFSEIYYKKRDLNSAYAYQSAYIALHDSLYNQRSSEQIALMQTTFETEMKQAQIELLTKDAALQAEEIDQQRIWIYFYGGCLSLLIILALVLFWYNRHNRSAKLALEQRNKAIEHQARQLRNLNATKDKLFSIISHDLRSPVASLLALMELISKSGLSQEQFVNITATLKRNLDSVYEDLDNLLLWAQTQLKGLQAFPESFDLGKLAEEKIKLFADLAKNKRITVTNKIPLETFVFADRNHVSLIFRNLIANAIKFNRTEGTITISVAENEDCCEIIVADTGVGISKEDIDKLFNAETHFTRPGTEKEKGVGIGLLITKEFVETNHGSITVNSQLGVGTVFKFSLKSSRQEVFA